MTAVHEPVDTRPAVDGDQPHDDLAERATLGAMLQSEQAIAEVADILQPVDYYRPGHAAIHRIVLDLYAQGKPANDWIVVVQEVLSQGVARQLPRDPASYLADLMRTVPTVANAGYYARIVRAHAENRNLIIAGTRIAELGRSVTDVDDPKGPRAAALLGEAMSERADSDGPVPIGDSLDGVLRRIESGAAVGLSTGFVDLDLLTNGMTPGLWIIGGRPGMGKSILLADMARSVAFRQHQPALLFALEMSREQIIMRILAAEARVPLHRLKQGGDAVTGDEWARLVDAQARLSEAPLYIDDSSALTVADIAARTRRMAAKGGLGFVGVDYLQLMGSVSAGRNDSREREVATISRGLKVLSGDLGATVAVAAQLNRGPEQRTDKRPTLSDLRESGAIEADADVVLLIHRPDYYDHESGRSGEADLIVAKNRDGPVDTVTVAAQLHLSKLVDMAVV